MAVGERIGEAFVEIGGDNSKLKRSVDDSFKLVNQSMQTLASITKAFGGDTTRSFESATAALTGGGGLLSTLAGVFDSIFGITKEAARLEQALLRVGATSGQVSKLKEDLQGAVQGTPFSTRQAFRSAIAIAESGGTAGEIAKIFELGIGATQRFGIGIEEAVAKAAASFAGKGDPFDLGLIGPLDVRRGRLREQLLPFAESARNVAFQDPLLGGGGVALARVADMFTKGLATVGPKLFGGFTEAQRIAEFQATLTKVTGRGPTARGLGIGQNVPVPEHLRAINEAEIQRALGFQIGPKQGGVLTDTVAIFEKLVPTAQEFEKWMGAGVDELQIFGAFLSDAPRIWAQAVDESLAALGASIKGFFDVPIGPGQGGSYNIGPGPGSPTSESTLPAALEEAFASAMRRSSVTPSAHRRPMLDVIV